MPKTKKLQKQIEHKLDQLSQLLNKIDEARAINSDDPATWDSDTLYNLAENLKETLKLLKDQKSRQLDNFGELIILETGLGSLVDSYQSEGEEEENF